AAPPATRSSPRPRRRGSRIRIADPRETGGPAGPGRLSRPLRRRSGERRQYVARSELSGQPEASVTVLRPPSGARLPLADDALEYCRRGISFLPDGRGI